MQRSRSRAIFVGALYVIIGTGSAALGAQEIYPQVKPLAFPLLLIVTAAINIRAFMDPTVAQLFPAETHPRRGGSAPPPIAATESAAIPEAGTIPLPAGPTQLSHLEQLASDGANRPRGRNFSAAQDEDEAEVVFSGPTSHEERVGDKTVYVMETPPGPRTNR